jgi:hypothetical protein
VNPAGRLITNRPITFDNLGTPGITQNRNRQNEEANP